MDEPIDLVLDVSRSRAMREPETGRIAVAWERNELEQLLGRTDDESITMVFDEDELRRLLDAEFEAHGMRGALAVLAVAVAAGGAASAAMAYPPTGRVRAMRRSRRRSGRADRGSQVRRGDAVGDAAASASRPCARRSRSLRTPVRWPRRRGSRPYGRRSRSRRTPVGWRRRRGSRPFARRSRCARIPVRWPRLGSRPFARRSRSLRRDTGALACGFGRSRRSRSAEPLAADTGARRIGVRDRGCPLGGAARCVVDTGALASSSAIESVRSAEAASARTPSATDGGFAVSLPSPESTAAVLGGFALLITGAAFVARSKRHELRLP